MNVCNGKLKKRLLDGEILVAAQTNMFQSTAVVEILSEAGYQMITIDLEHSALTIENVSEQVRLARALDIPCMVRVATPDYDNLNRVLDQGADGLYVPRIRSVDEVRSIIRLIHYPPEGERGLAGYGCPLSKYRGWSTKAEQVRVVNENTVLGIQIETKEALDHMEEILALNGIDVAVIGCDDLTAALGIPGETSNPLFIEAVERFISLCQENHIAPGVPCSTPEAAFEWIRRGMRILWYGLDAGLLWEGASRRINGLREQLSGTEFEKFQK